jgi:hypothetical protein
MPLRWAHARFHKDNFSLSKVDVGESLKSTYIFFKIKKGG